MPKVVEHLNKEVDSQNEVKIQSSNPEGPAQQASQEVFPDPTSEEQVQVKPKRSKNLLSMTNVRSRKVKEQDQREIQGQGKRRSQVKKCLNTCKSRGNFYPQNTNKRGSLF